MSRLAQFGRWPLLIALLLVAAGGAFAQARGSQAGTPVDRRNVKQVWDSLTPAERQAYRQLVAGSRATAFGRELTALPPNMDCDLASPDRSDLPRIQQGTTETTNDTYVWGAECGCNVLDRDQPNCGGFNGDSGVGPDLAYEVVVDQDCIIEVTLTPTDLPPDDDDLALYVTTDCDDIEQGCSGAQDFGGPGVAEDVTFTANAGTPYFVVVDGFMGDAGPFELTVEESTQSQTGCALVPVELLRGGVD